MNEFEAQVFAEQPSMPESLEDQIESHLVQREDVDPRSWIRMPHGDEVNQDATDVLVGSVREVQRAGLHQWAEHLREYPSWFRDYAFGELVKLGAFDLSQGKFKERDKGCMAPFPQLSAEALGCVYERAEASDRRSFGQLYSHALDEVSELSPEERREQEGSWIKIGRTDDWEESWLLGRFFAVCGFKWKVLDPEHPQPSPLLSGDYYIYCSPNEDGVHCVPRLGVGTFTRFERHSLNGIVGAQHMNVEPEMEAVLQEKLQQLQKKDEEMLDQILRGVQEDPRMSLHEFDLRLIYQPVQAIYPDIRHKALSIREIRRSVGVDQVWLRDHCWGVDKPIIRREQHPKNRLQRMLGRLSWR